MSQISPSRSFVHVSSGGQEALIPLSAVLEVLPMVTLLSFGPAKDPLYVGALHYRGTVVPAFLWSATERRDALDSFLVVLRTAGETLAYAIEEVFGVVEVPAADIDRRSLGGTSVTVVRWAGRLLPVRPDVDGLAQSERFAARVPLHARAG